MPKKRGNKKKDIDEQLAAIWIEKKESAEPSEGERQVGVVSSSPIESEPSSKASASSDASTVSKRSAESTEASLLLPKPEQKPKEQQNTHTLMKRPGYGGLGTKIQLYANFYPVNLKPLDVIHYDLAFWRKSGAKTSKSKKNGGDVKAIVVSKQGGDEADANWIAVSRLPRFLASLIVKDLYNNNKNIFRDQYGLAYDGQKNLMSVYQLPGISEDKSMDFYVPIQNPEKQIKEEFKVTIKQASKITVDLRRVFAHDLRERDSLATLIYDIVLKQKYFFSDEFIPQGRRIFYRADPIYKFPLGNGIYRYPGFWQSLRPVTGWKVMLNMDQANTSFVQGGKVIDFIKNLGFSPNNIPRDPRDFKTLCKKLEKALKGIKITQTQRANHRTAKCTAVSTVSANNLKFIMEEGGRQRSITVAAYFIEQFNKKEFISKIRYPDFPCLKVGTKSWVPIEFCEIKEGQRYSKKLDGQQTTQMLRVASQNAPTRKNLIEEDMGYLKLQEDPYLKAFGITVGSQMVQFGGRVLESPTVQYANSTITPKDGGWNMRDVKVIKACTIRNFAIIMTTERCPQNQMMGFISEWLKSARSMGIIVKTSSPSRVILETFADQMHATLKSLKANVPQLDLVFVALDGQNTDYYAHVKQAGDVVEGINTQCVQLKNVMNPKPSTMANINLKINGKLGGINSEVPRADMKKIVHWVEDEIMYIGADVNHDAPDDVGMEPVSCAAIVASIDNKPSLYSSRIFLQHQERNTENGSMRRPQEWIGGMRDGVHKALEDYVRCRGVLPRRIIMYRDGVGETMFGLVLHRELTGMREACRDISSRYPAMVKKSSFKGDYQPSITFIVVQKRHHTRLFPVNQRDSMVKNGYNVPPGTTVDTTITHPEEFDFYLCSHLGLQGTSKPTHYHVLWDENNFKADELQMLTNYLCYTYCRATKAVAIPTPCYYADLAAYRARQYLKAIFGSETASQASGAVGGTGRSALVELQRIVNVHDEIIRRGMFFV